MSKDIVQTGNDVPDRGVTDNPDVTSCTLPADDVGNGKPEAPDLIGFGCDTTETLAPPQPFDLLVNQVSDLNAKMQNAASGPPNQSGSGVAADSQTQVFSQLLLEMANLNKNLQAVSQGQAMLVEKLTPADAAAGSPVSKVTDKKSETVAKETETVPGSVTTKNRPQSQNKTGNVQPNNPSGVGTPQGSQGWTGLFETFASYFPGGNSACTPQSVQETDGKAKQVQDTKGKGTKGSKTKRSDNHADPDVPICFPYKMLEEATKDYIVFLENDLDQLIEQKLKIEKLVDAKQWESLNVEQLNTSKTVQRLLAVVQNFHGTYQKISPCDLPLFRADVRDVLQKAIECVVQCLEVQYSRKGEPLADVTIDSGEPVASSNTGKPSQDDVNQSDHDKVAAETSDDQTAPGECPMTSPDTSLEEYIPPYTEYKQSRNDLNVNPHPQEGSANSQSEVDGTTTSEQPQAEGDNTGNTETSEEAEGMFTAKKVRAALLPVAGALLGGVMAGPVGIVAGAKVGGIAAVTGGLAGLGGGHLLKKHEEQQSRDVANPPDVLPAPAPAEPGQPGDHSQQEQATEQKGFWD